nr:hypothetical protein [Streptomyces canus]
MPKVTARDSAAETIPRTTAGSRPQILTMRVPFEIEDCSLKDRSVFFHVPEKCIAVKAEQFSNGSRRVVVVDVEQFRFVRCAAYAAAALLSLQHGIGFFNADPVFQAQLVVFVDALPFGRCVACARVLAAACPAGTVSPAGSTGPIAEVCAVFDLAALAAPL